MKINGNNTKNSDYYIGLDVGTNSVGWAVTDKEYNILRFKGNAMWGVRLFDEAQDASERRTARTTRRRLQRQKQRINLLEILFSDEISKIDPGFFQRLHDSSLYKEDKKDNQNKYAIFNDKDYTDADYLKDYPTIYHLRNELIHSSEPHDVRLVYLAIHHIIKNRGHFLYDSDSGDNQSLSDAIKNLNIFLSDEYGVSIEFTDKELFEEILSKSDMTIPAKKKALKSYLAGQEITDETGVNISVLSDALAGATVKLADLFLDASLKDIENKSICLKNITDETLDKLPDEIGDRSELVLQIKSVFDTARLSQILGDNAYISEAKLELYNKNKASLLMLKRYVKEFAPDKYKRIFSEKKKDLKNYAAYSRYKSRSGDYTCSQEEFCLFLKSTLPKPPSDSEYISMFAEIENKTFLSRLTGSDNSVIPYQLHLKELEAILNNASQYLDFLNQTDSDGIDVKSKITDIFKFRIPYYVGPLNKNSPNSWVVRTSDKIYPWNFDKNVDVQKSAEAFIINLIGKCSYTGKDAVPKDSLLYSEYMVLNEINSLKINGAGISPELKNDIFNDLFVKSNNKKLTKKSMKNYLLLRGVIKKDDEISGVDDVIKSKLKSYHDFETIIQKTGDTEMVEEIIRRVLLFGDDRKMLRSWLNNNCGSLDNSDINYICRLKYKDWGRLSKEFLTEIYHIDENGEAHSIMDMLRSTNLNLMQLLSSEFTFAEKAEAMRRECVGANDTLRSKVDNLYIPAMVKRSVWQALKIVDEIVDIKKSAPAKIFIEVARGNNEQVKKRTVSRKERLLGLYKACKTEDSELLARLTDESEQNLRKDKLYLYYTQFGRCMYSGEKIDISDLYDDNKYDIDHIFPQSRIIDDSLDNRVLVKKELNHNKSNKYPIDADIRKNMYLFWSELKNKELISDKKFTRLTRSSRLTDDELSSFVSRQVVETQQSTKAIASVMKEIYPETTLVYSKAGNVARFKQEYGFVKCREVNDLHHAKDAYLNIVVGNVYDTKFTSKFFLNIRNENYSLNRVFDYDVPGAWTVNSTIATVRKYMAKNNILYTRMPHETKGKLFKKLQIVPAAKGQLPVKNGKSIQKYGGYTDLTGAYFFVAEHKDKKKRIRTIQPVLLYKKALYECDPIKYCTEILGLEEPVIIVNKIYFDALLEINGNRVNITGRTGERNIYKHAYQLAIDLEHEKYIKSIIKYSNRCAAAQKELPVTSYDGISSEKNIDLYNWFIAKFHSKAYEDLLKNVCNYVEAETEKFAGMSLLEQCDLLIEILKSFKCDRQASDLSMLCGKARVGEIKYSNKLSNMQSAKLINQSITGLYETEIDLLT